MVDAPEPVVPPPVKPAEKKKGCLFYGCVVSATLVVVIVATALVTAWWVKRQIDPKPFEPTVLTQPEQQQLEAKLEVLRGDEEPAEEEAAPVAEVPDASLTNRQVTITEREINALVSEQSGLGDKIYISLSRDRISARANIPIDDTAPMLGGRTLRGKVDLFAAVRDEGLELRVQNIYVGGLALPNAWIGGIKHKNLVREFGEDPAVKAFAAGIESLEIEKGRMTLTVTE